MEIQGDDFYISYSELLTIAGGARELGDKKLASYLSLMEQDLYEMVAESPDAHINPEEDFADTRFIKMPAKKDLVERCMQAYQAGQVASQRMNSIARELQRMLEGRRPTPHLPYRNRHHLKPVKDN